jgi:prepilin-type N-terminal cleavage/methylation domain-containing protein
MEKNHGFTLIELLIVVCIVGILSALLLVVVNPAALLAKARDAKRIEYVENLNKALVLAENEGEITLIDQPNCTDCTSASGSIAVDGSGYVRFSVPLGKTGLYKYIHVLPMDPLNSGANVIKFGSNGKAHELNVVLESADNAPMMTTDGGNAPNLYEVGTSLSIL